MNIKINTALISVTDKTGIIDFAKFLRSQKVEILSTGGTAQILRDAGITVRDVSQVTGFPEIMDGRVKTLHPNIHGGLLARRNKKTHMSALKKHNIEAIDMVIVNLYEFEKTVDKGADFASCIENIDIGGPSMIRSAAKNHNDVVVITSPSRYADVKSEMEANKGKTSLDLRKSLASEAFTCTGKYDSAISAWFNAQTEGKNASDTSLSITAELKQPLRYGENPHQKAALYVNDNKIPSVVNAQQLQGKELSYNNISDTDAAFDLVNEFDEPTVAIIKHANPCGIATDANLASAYEKALACDPVSAFGGIFAFNRTLDLQTTELLSKLFAEVIIAPKIDEDALEILAKKKNLRVLITGSMPDRSRDEMLVKSVSGGLLMQNRDNETLDEEALIVATKRKPTKQELKDMIFAFKVCKHVKSNAIVFVKDAATIGIGAGQMSRVDSSRIGAWKAKETATSVTSAAGSIMASDAFLPFADGLISAAEHGVTAVIQPGGSIRDEEVIAAANERNIAMVFTGIRHFRH